MGYQKSALRNSVLSSGVWYRFSISEDGMYKLTGQMMVNAGIPPSTDPNTIKVYGNGGSELSMSPRDISVDDLIENAIDIFDSGTLGRLDPEDYIVFFGKGTRGWKYNSTTKAFNHYLNHFTETNFYWLTYGGATSKHMTVIPSLNQPDVYRPAAVLGKIFREDEKVSILSSGLEWLGQSFNTGEQMTYVHPLYALDTTRAMTYQFHIGARSSGSSQFMIYEHGDQLLSPIEISSTQVGSYFDKQFKSVVISTTQVPKFSDVQSQLRFRYNSVSPAGVGYIDWYEIFYSKFLKAQNDVFNFHSKDTTSITEYAISGFSGGQIRVFDVTNFDSLLIISNPLISPSNDRCSFQVQLSSGSTREFYIVGSNGYKTPGSLNRIANQNLHGEPMEADYIIVSHPEFLPAAQRLKTYREQPGTRFLRSLVVDIQQIYNEFSGGLPTPIAVRNYLKYIYETWRVPPRYVLLFGDGNYDYKGILSSDPNWIPPWETSESFWPLLSYATDDGFVTFNNVERVNLGLGRLSARTIREAHTMVDKIIEYETNPAIDPWKVRFTFVADDGPAGAGDRNNYFIHTDQAEAISRMVPALFENKKIYLYEYPTIYAPGGRRKPAVNIAIQNQINQGTLVLNFTGHGNPRLWTHEAVFVRETDFPLLRNKGKYFFLVAATCNYSQFDVIGEQSGGEILLEMPEAGAISVFSATRPVFAFDNFLLNETLYEILFQKDSIGRIVPQRLGDLIYRTKQRRTSDNDRKYFLLGDPALQLAFPELFASVDSINNVHTSQTTQLQALSKASLKASVRDSVGQQEQNFTGRAQVVVYDASRRVRLYDPDGIESEYIAQGSVLYRGEQSITNGMLHANFIVPKDISYGDDYGRATIYFWNSSLDGAGSTTNFRVGGTDTTALQDIEGPQIQLFIDQEGFRAGDVVKESPVLLAHLFDVNGINTSGSGIGHRLEAWLDEQRESIDLTDYYKSVIDDYQNGRIEYPLGILSLGPHKLRIRAWDTYNNSSTTETVFDVVTSVGLQLYNIFNYPNPFSSSTFFTFEHNQIVPIDAEIKIYSVAGRLLRSLEERNINNRTVRIEWDGRDDDGDVLANGIYLYKVVVKTEDRRFTDEALGKLSILK
ncbi:MAG TPA: type IX secretion system sortase PorU [Bacteroidota bacterium]|nr:type IX secretion system sortase PorU [Bacteroidota bacterium]